MPEQMPPHAVAIIGLAGRFPGAPDLDAFWRNLSTGVEILEPVSDAEMDAAGVPASARSNPNYVPKCTPLQDADCFDANFFKISPREAQVLDPQHRIFLECAWEALESAGYSEHGSDSSVGVYAGASMNTYLANQLMRNPALVATVGGYQIMLGNDKDYLCTRASYKLDLHGPSVTIQTACSTSLVAVVMACQALNRGECDIALAGGVSVIFPQCAGYLYEEGMIFSPDGHCRPFDSEARGTRVGAGVGIVVLKRLSDALADRDTIHAVIRGAAMNNDGAAKVGYTAPSIDGQAEAIVMAQTLAGIDPRTISYVETHGTGTQLGDPIEIAALTKVFRTFTPDIGFCRLGALKANIGHLDAAAGVAGLIKTVLALKNREIPPLANFRAPNPQLDLDRSPFTASAQGGPWVSDGAPRRAGVSSFGIGGTNAHVVLEEAPPALSPTVSRDTHLLVLSAKTPEALDEATTRLADFLENGQTRSLSDVEWTLQVGRQAFAHRRAVVVKSEDQAVKLLHQPGRMPVLTAEHQGGARPVAFLFSGQGSQHAGMGAELYAAHRVYRDAIDRCAEILRPHLGLDIRDVMGTKTTDVADVAINETHFAQPALFAIEYALACLWKSWGVTPKAMLGHSIGEYAAAHLAGVMSLEDALAVVAARGRLMQELPPGDMAAVHLPAAELAQWLGDGIDIAAVNAPRLCTISGPSEPMADLLKRLAAQDIESTLLKTSHAFHSAMMEPALSPFTEVLKDVALSPPTIPYVSNVTGTWITAEQATSPAYYASQLRQAVQFQAGVQEIASDPAVSILEVGPGTALASLARVSVGKERAKHVISSLPHAREQHGDSETMFEAAGRLWLAGVSLDWAGFHNHSTPQRIPLPTYPFERKRHWVEAAAVAPAETPGLQRGASVEDWLFAPTWTRDDVPIGKVVDLKGRWLVLAQPGALANAMADRLTQAGAEAIWVEPSDKFEIIDPTHVRVRPGVSEDVTALIRDMRGSEQPIRGAIYLWGVTGTETAGDVISYDALVALAEGLPASSEGPGPFIIVATLGAESVFGEPVQNRMAAIAHGPVRTLPAEVSGLHMRAVDFDWADRAEHTDEMAAALISEAANGDGENFVAWRAGHRWVRRYERIRLPVPDQLPLKPRGVYLITGGLGGIGVALARWLAARTSARLLLTARTPLPPREEWQSWLSEHETNNTTSQSIRDIMDIEAAGGEVITAAADAASLPQMSEAVDRARKRWGEIDGVIHAAGIPGTGSITFLKQHDDVRSVFSPKIDGLAVLIHLLGETKLDFVALMSSIDSVLGGPGVSDYSAANAVLDAFVDDAERPTAWRQVVAFNWMAWRDVGMAAKLVVPEARRASWDEHVRGGIPTAEGLDAFARILGSGRRRVVISAHDLVHVDELMRRQREVGEITTEPPDAAASVTAAAPRSVEVATATARSGDTELGEIEETLRRHAAVRQAVVVASRGGASAGDRKLVAYVVYENGQDLTATEVRRHLRKQRPGSAIPSVVVAMDAIPLAPSGEVDRKALPDPFSNTGSEDAHEKLASGAEAQIAEVWKRVLGVERVSAADNFFELGGHSLLALSVVRAIEKETGWRMDPRAMFFQNLREVALALERQQSAADRATA